jgi:hypothetical protein
MNLQARPGFRRLVGLLDAANPVLVGLSVVGLFIEYTPAAPWAVVPNNLVSMLFLFDFLVRLAAFPAGDYFFRSFGWVDGLASLPGAFVFFEGADILAVFKVVRIGRFFRIIRVLRFLRAFDFIKKMRGDSAWIQQRIMQTGVAVVLLYVAGLILMEVAVFADPAFAPAAPAYNGIMLCLLGTLVAILVVLIFYLGAVFAKDMRIVQLIIDSADAEDYGLLAAEAEPLKDGDGAFRVEEGELETLSLLKMSAKLAAAAGDAGGGFGDLGGFGGFGAEPAADGAAGGDSAATAAALEELNRKVDRLEDLLRASQEKVAMETIRRVVPAIRKFLAPAAPRPKGL